MTHVLRTRAPCAHPPPCGGKLRTRLACVKHAASVRSEPGSNSRLNLVILKIKTPAEPGPDFQDELFVARFIPSPDESGRGIYSSYLASRVRDSGQAERVLARIIRLSKSGPPVQQVGFQAIQKYSQRPLWCQATDFGGFQQRKGRACIRGGGQQPGGWGMLRPAQPAGPESGTRQARIAWPDELESWRVAAPALRKPQANRSAETWVPSRVRRNGF